MTATLWKVDSYPGGAWFTCDRCSQRVRRSAMFTEWDGLKVCAPCLDPRPPQMFPPDVYPEGLPFPDTRPPQDSPDRLVDDTILNPVAGGIQATNGLYGGYYPNGQLAPPGAMSPQPVIVDTIPPGQTGPAVLTDMKTLRTGPVFSVPQTLKADFTFDTLAVDGQGDELEI